MSTIVVTLLLPGLLVIALVVDGGRALLYGNKAVLSRALVFAWVYLLGESWAVVALGLAALLGRQRSVEITYKLQKAWAAWVVAALRVVFGLRIVVEGEETIDPGPILILSRHVSLVDSLLPAEVVTNRHGIRLSYVLKRELLLDPALDIAGNRLANHFVDRRSRDSDAELAAISALGASLGPSEGVVIFPEGTRFTEEKLARDMARLRRKEQNSLLQFPAYRSVLPPRAAGTLALLEATSCDIVILAHYGLEGFSGLADAWSGSLVGSEVFVRFWRFSRHSIPAGRAERMEWLYKVWSDVDLWVQAKQRAQKSDQPEADPPKRSE